MCDFNYVSSMLANLFLMFEYVVHINNQQKKLNLHVNPQYSLAVNPILSMILDKFISTIHIHMGK